MARRSTPKRLGRAHVAAARVRRSAKGRASWLAEDLTGDDVERLPELGRTAVDPEDWDNEPSSRRRPVPPSVAARSRRPAGDAPGFPATRPDDTDGDRLRTADDPTPVPSVVPAVVPSVVPDRSPVVPDDGRDDGRDGHWVDAVPIDPPAVLETAWADRGGRPLVPEWLAHPGVTIRRRVSYGWHVVLFHILHSPEYVLRALGFAPVGLVRTVRDLWDWALDAEGRELRWSAAARDDAREYLHLSRQRNQRVHNRAPAAVALVVAVLVALALAMLVSPWSPLTRFVVPAGVVWLLARRGVPHDRPLVEHAIVPPAVRRITPDLLVQAFASAKLCTTDPDRPPGPIRFAAPIAHEGPGVRAVVDLPPGVTATEALGRRERIAAGLDVDEFRVFLDRVRGTTGSARRLIIWVADKDPYEQRSPLSPLAAAKSWDFWKPFPFGVDARGRTVAVPLVWSSLLVGSIPRMGKTNAARIPAAAAALDPHCRLIIFDGKGGKDWQPFAECAHFYASGIRDVVVEQLVEILRETVGDMNRRFERMMELPDDLCPDGKVTPEITRRKSLGMPLTLVCVDEVHRYLEHPEHGKTIEGLLANLAKAAPAAGCMLVLATQRPDSKIITDDLRGQIGTRFALRTMNYHASETILGQGTYSAGLDSSKFLRSHLGVGILLGAGDDTQIGDGEAVTVRTHLLDITNLRRLAARGRQLRLGAGTLTGTAAGEAVIDDTPARLLLDDVLDVLEPDEDRVWSEVICSRLAARWPQVYDGWDATALANVLRPYGVDTHQVWGHTTEGEGANRRGVRRQALLDAIAAREPRPPGPDTARDP